MVDIRATYLNVSIDKLRFTSNNKSEYLKTKKIIINEQMYPPTTPAYVLFGLILVILGPLNILPNKYPPRSVKIQTKRTNKKSIKLLSPNYFSNKKHNRKKHIIKYNQIIGIYIFYSSSTIHKKQQKDKHIKKY